jgi:outer membrane protein assembly factor BamB
MHVLRSAACFLLTVLVSFEAPGAAAVSGWRGDGSGLYREAAPPLRWGPSSNVLWRTALPEWSNASPLVLGDRVFVCAEPAALVCLALDDGRVLWRRSLEYADLAATPAEAEAIRERVKQAAGVRARADEAERKANRAREAAKKDPTNEVLAAAAAAAREEASQRRRDLEPFKTLAPPGTHAINGFSTATPATDGQAVYVFFGLGTAGRFLPDGTRTWAREIGRPRNGWGHSASPVLSGGTLFIHVGDVLYACDAATGEVRWQAPSPSGWGTPLIAGPADRPVVVTPAGDCFDVADGHKRAGGLFRCPWNAPVTDGEALYVIDEGLALAMPLPAEGQAAATRWRKTDPKARFYATGLVFDGLVYNVNQNGALSVYDAKDGALVYAKDLDLGRGGKTVYPSLVVGGGRLYVSADNGQTVAIATGREYAELARNSLAPFRSTPVCAGRRLLIRTLDALYCLAEPGGG